MNERTQERATTPTIIRKPGMESRSKQQQNLDTPVSAGMLQSSKQQPPVTQDSGNVKVVCRFRPLNQKEIEINAGSGIEFPNPSSVVVRSTQLTDTTSGVYRYNFDKVFDTSSCQKDVYEFSAKPVVLSVLEGFNGTVFAYGQTSSGKTHTMQGNIDNAEFRGVIPRMVGTVFDTISETPEHIEFTVKVSIVEVYMERIRDLLAPDKNNLKIRQDKQKGIYIDDVTESYVTEEKDIFDLMRLGNSNRAISATNMNEGSSRSHLIFTLSIHQNNNNELSAKTGKLYLIDLAGSEKISKTGAQGQTLEEAKNINQSLSALGNVINALTEDKKKHIPYRDSKLTRLLQESLGGNAKTTLIITCSPSMFNEAETISTLRFGQRAKSVKNTPKINKEYTVAELQLLLDKSERTVAELRQRITQLENFILTNGLKAPSLEHGSAALPAGDHSKADHKAQEREGAKGKDTSDSDDEVEESADKMDKDAVLLKQMTNDDDLARIKVLEAELQSEKNSVRTQTEKLNILRKEFAFMNVKSVTNEKENEALIHKLATITMKMQEIEDQTSEKEDEVDRLSCLKDTLVAEINGLRETKDQLMHLLEEKDRELDSFKNQSETQASVRNRVPASDKELQLNPPASLPVVTEDDYLDLVRKLQVTFDLKDELLLKKTLNNYFTRRHLGTPSASEPTDVAEVSEKLDPEREMERLREELSKSKKALQLERENVKKLEADNDQVTQNYESLIKDPVPDYDELKKQIEQEIVSKEEQKYEKERQGLLADIQTRVNKVVKLEVELKEEKDRSRELENRVGEVEQMTKKKIITLENNLEQLTGMYHQLASQKSIWKVDSQLSDNKFKKKTDRIINLEKQLHQTKELVTQYKSKIESLKTLVSMTNNTGSISIASADKSLKDESDTSGHEGSTSFARGMLQSDYPSSEASMMMKRTLSSALSNPKIVKHIRGGTKGFNAGIINKTPQIIVKQSQNPASDQFVSKTESRTPTEDSKAD